MLLGTLGTYVLGNQPTGKGIYRSGQGITRAEEWFLRGGQGTKKKSPNATTFFKKPWNTKLSQKWA